MRRVGSASDNTPVPNPRARRFAGCGPRSSTLGDPTLSKKKKKHSVPAPLYLLCRRCPRTVGEIFSRPRRTNRRKRSCRAGSPPLALRGARSNCSPSVARMLGIPTRVPWGRGRPVMGHGNQLIFTGTLRICAAPRMAADVDAVESTCTRCDPRRFGRGKARMRRNSAIG